MSNMRQDEPLVRGYAVTHPPGEVRLPTLAGWHQVLYARSGALVARTARASWTVPAHRVLCIGDTTRVRVSTSRPTSVRCLYLRVELEAVPPSVRVTNVPSFTRELLLHAVSRCPLGDRAAIDVALVTLLVDQLVSLPEVGLRLPLPVDARALDLAERIDRDPARPLRALVSGVGASRRTLERLFRSETKMSPAAWQRRARMLIAVERLSLGDSVTEVASAVGYATPSSFAAGFRAELGTTPQAFVRA